MVAIVIAAAWLPMQVRAIVRAKAAAVTRGEARSAAGRFTRDDFAFGSVDGASSPDTLEKH